MKRENVLLEKSLAFAARIVKLHKYLVKEKHEGIISKQIIRSGTSIGANANEAVYGISKADFVSKLQIALKECYESEQWLALFAKTNIISDEIYTKLKHACGKIRKLLIASINTTKERYNL